MAAEDHPTDGRRIDAQAQTTTEGLERRATADADRDDVGAPEPTTDRDDAAADRATVLEIDGLRKDFGPECAVDDLSLSVQEGELMTLLGPSGCGKTTTLRTIAGLEQPDEGTISIDGECVADGDTATAPESRDVGLVFQDFALFPHLSAAENVAFGISDWPKVERAERVDELLDLVGLADQRESSPAELSGGQQQRIALARALAPEPDLLLLDEPFSNLDKDLRVRTREEVRRILIEAGVTAVFVTHDQEEALSISDRVAVMHEGSIEQAGHPEQVFQHPTSRFVAGFLGHASFLSAYVHDDVVETEIGELSRDRIHGLASAYDRTTVDVLVRPDDVVARPCPSSVDPDGTVTYRRYLGPSVLYRVELENGDAVECMHNHSANVDLDEEVCVDLTANHDLAWFPRAEHTE
ncbi:ABC transporter-like protein [Salinarchaeum sp. Harcht-Bsk1]|uniref:ABC transporter ATP-binding protein n=1 Tax=Salinarchaeum sp. Harcht-Bsk1 TaxID=1333523 RepID=UPI0003422A6B|nr:ABC transporter ATP-binding protein [Salinarchaeum sp. Harcht-Bsk1]AGN00143.1 ABC transporter-like protein [Salinarchaeum sp. Harcht-Bsk1]